MLTRFARWANGCALRAAAIYHRPGAYMPRNFRSAPAGETREFDLDVLIAGITVENRHEEICTGSICKEDAP